MKKYFYIGMVSYQQSENSIVNVAGLYCGKNDTEAMGKTLLNFNNKHLKPKAILSVGVIRINRYELLRLLEECELSDLEINAITSEKE